MSLKRTLIGALIGSCDAGIGKLSGNKSNPGLPGRSKERLT